MVHFTYKIGTPGQRHDTLGTVIYSTVIVGSTVGEATQKAERKFAEELRSELATRAMLVTDDENVVWITNL
ncbi:hypothetical protein [Shinella sp. M27]|uniref:hypothetical protein n=1 Tax=Shinella sp. M27 TaxID=3368614 RepID=UPI003B9EBE94